MKTNRWIYIVAMASAFLPGVLDAQETPGFVSALDWQASKQSAFPTSIATDAQNSVWVGTEDKGVWRYDMRSAAWTQFTVKDGLGDDNIYAMAVDKLGRVWAGHLNHGVSVWNGEKWKNYGLLDGPLGDRVFAITTSPKDGDVWIATDCGLARYSIAKNDWDYFTQASGLPSNQIQCIGFDSTGNIFVGTQCDGVAMAGPADNYRKWSVATGPVRMPTTSGGTGLSTNLVSCVTAYSLPAGMYHEKADVVDLWTSLGECETVDGGKKWTFTRGVDWQANVAGLYNAPAVGDAVDDSTQFFLEDWITCVQQDAKTKNTWIGYRQKGLEVRDINGKPLTRVNTGNRDTLLIRAICITEKLPPLIAIYDREAGGLKTLDNSTVKSEPGAEPSKSPAPFPAAAKAPDAESLAALTKRLDIYQKELAPGEGVFLGDDWRTCGDWAGRYGTGYALLCGMSGTNPPGEIYTTRPDYAVAIGLGPHTNKADATPRLHVGHSFTEDMHVLYSPALTRRSEAEINDGSYDLSDYPSSWDGPDLWVDVKVPAGTHCVSLYFRNDDAQSSGRWNKLRDYDVQLLPWSENKDDVQKADPLARARVADFWGGVYKQFAVAGPARYVFRVGRNRSFGTKLQGVFIDQQTGAIEAKKNTLPGFEKMDYNMPATGDINTKANPLLAAASGLWEKLGATLDKRGALGLQLPLYVWDYRAAVAANAPAPLLANWRWQTTIWTPEDRKQFDDVIDRIHRAKENGGETMPVGTQF